MGSLRSSKRSSKSKTPELKLPLTAVESTSPVPPADKTSMSTTMTTKTTTARVREKGFKADGSPHSTVGNGYDATISTAGLEDLSGDEEDGLNEYGGWRKSKKWTASSSSSLS